MSIISPLPFNLQNGTTADATQVMADLNQIYNNVNSNAVAAGANTNITSLSGLTIPLSASQGGTGSASPTANCVVVAEGPLSPMNFIGPGTAGQALGSNGAGADPSFQGGFVPSGAAMWWPTATAPAGWVEAAGQSTSGMSAAIIAIYGATLPDMRGVFARGWDHGRGLDPHAPSLLQYEVDQVGPHNHTITDPGHTHAGNPNPFLFATGSNSQYASGSNGTVASATASGTTGITINNSTGSETNPKYMAWMFIIKS